MLVSNNFSNTMHVSKDSLCRSILTDLSLIKLDITIFETVFWVEQTHTLASKLETLKSATFAFALYLY